MKFEYLLDAYWYCRKHGITFQPKKTGLHSWEV